MAVVQKQVVQYETIDGSVFATMAEAESHEFKLENGEVIRIAAESFVNSRGAIDRSRNMQLNTIGEFLAFYIPWVAAGSVFVERTVPDTVKEVAVVEGEAVSDEAVAAAAEVAPQETDAPAGTEMF